MAEQGMIFPIEFDLEKGVEEASKDWDKYAKKLEAAIAKRAIKVRLSFDTKNLDNIDAVKKRLAQLKIEPVTTENQAAIKELVKELTALAKVMEKVSSLRGVELPELQAAKAAKIRKDIEQADEKLRLSQERVRQAQERLTLSQQRAEQQATKTSRAYGEQSLHLKDLIRQMVSVWSVQRVSFFLSQIKNVTAEFELQRVSLGAIIQDQTRANQLFSEIKAFAVKSPVKLLDLTKYVKQVAAYKVETDKLFDTTKRLADVSVGLGVDMGRLVLAFGQVKAASYLRAAEIRQFTEAGIPMLELLAEKFTELNGEAVTTEQVMEMVSKRMVDFGMVEQIFNDMTSAGGMFYNMQEKQGNTLYGLWAKLGDAAAIMYDEIGNTEVVNSSMKYAIQLMSDLMKNWRELGRVAMMAVGGFAAFKVVSAAMKMIRVDTIAAAQAARQLERAQVTLNAAQTNGDWLSAKQAKRTIAVAEANKAAAMSTSLFGTALNRLKALFLGNWVTILIAALGFVVEKFISAYENAHKLENALNDIKKAATIESDQSVMNFEALANAAVKAADGSKQQREALQELENTYKNIIPLDDLKIEKLRALQGNYESLTVAIREYIAQQKLQEGINTIVENYADEIKEQTDDFRNILKKQTFTEKGADVKLSDRQVERIVDNYKRLVKEGKEATNALRESFKMEGLDETAAKADQLVYTFGLMKQLISPAYGVIDSYATGLTRTLQSEARAIENLTDGMDELFPKMGKFGDYLKEAEKEVEEHTFAAKIGTFEYDQESIKTKTESYIKALGKAIQDATKNSDAKINLSDFIATTPDGIKIIDYERLKKAIDAGNIELGTSLKTTVDAVEKNLKGLVPSDAVALQIRTKLIQIANSFGPGFIDKFKQFMWDGSGSVDDYLKNLHGQIDTLEAELVRKETALVNQSLLDKTVNYLLGRDAEKEIADIKARLKVLKEEFVPFVKGYIKSDESDNGRRGGRKSDPRLQNLKEEISLVQKLYNEYKQLEKQEGMSKAAEDMRKMAGATIDMFKKKYGFDLPTDAKDLTSALEILYKKMAALPKKVFPSLDKDLKELRWTIEKVNIDESQKKIEAQLKQLADRISRTKAAREFYDKVLGMTGDVELAATLTFTVHGEDGKALKQQIIDNIQATLGKTKEGVDIDFSSAIRADKTVDYNELVRVADAQLKLGNISEDTHNKILKMRDEDRKDLAKTIDGWLKATEKAKSYSDKMIDLARTTNTEIARINAQKSYAQERVTELLGLGVRTAEEQTELTNLQKFLAEAETLIQRFKDKQAQEEVKLGYEAFKDSPMYIQMFDDLDHASTKMLENMKDRIRAMQIAWKDLDPTQLKELQSRLDEIDKQLATRNPFKALIKGIKDYRALAKNGDSRGNKSAGEADADLMATAKATDVARTRFEEALRNYGKEGETYEQMLERLRKENVKGATELEDAKNGLDKAMSDEAAAQKAVEMWKKLKDGILGAMEAINALTQSVLQTATEIKDAFGGFGDEFDDQYFDDMVNSFGKVANGAVGIARGISAKNPISIVQGIGSAISGIAGLFSSGKVRKANKEIKRQQELLDGLEYAYRRLEKAADKVFGSDYVDNYNAQMRNLQAQAAAYRRQAEAERGKGKKADDAKIQEYENAYRETMDSIADMQGRLAEQMAGTDVASAARDFAQAWLEAYASFGDTAGAIKGKFDDMIKNLVVNSVLARVVQQALQPMFDDMDKMYESGKSMTEVLGYAFRRSAELAEEINGGLTVAARDAEKAGVDIKSLYASSDNLKGISRDIAGASEETMGNVAAIGNTLMYYVSPIPGIAANVAAMRALLESGGSGATAVPGATAAGWTDWQQQAMDHYAAIQRNTADTVTECRRAADACASAAEGLRRVIVPRGTKGSHGVQVYM